MRTIRLLGGASILEPGVIANGRVVQRTRIAVLALLALSRTHSASREYLMARLWPESDSSRARHLLRESLYRLRETLGDDALVSAGDEVRLDSDQVACDVWDFEAAVARQDWAGADGLYAGPLLDGFFVNDAPEFERWVDGERARLEDIHARALESLAVEHAERGDWIGAVDFWRRRAVADPHNSRIALRLMEALDAAGDRAAALKHAAVHVELLKSDLGAAPDPAVAALAEELRREPAARARTNAPTDAVRVDHGAPHEISRALHDTALLENDAQSLATVGRGRVATLARIVSGRFSGRRAAYVGLSALAVVAVLTAGVVGTHLPHAKDALDENRIAILPFRTSGVDPELAALHDGLVELLSSELTGNAGPAAVDAGEVLMAWRRAEIGADPVTRDLALRVARQLRAGQVAYGAVVGTARRLTVTLSVLHVSDGSVSIPSVTVEGTMDSLPVVVAALSAKLLARSAGAWRLSANDPEHTSTEVLRAYVRGMVEYRRANWPQAGAELFHALELDSTFAPAAYRFALIHAIIAPRTPLGGPPSPDRRFIRLYRRLWSDRLRLSAEQRVLLEAVVDSHYVLWRMQALPRLERATTLFPSSAEAWDILGDDYYHAGALIGRKDWAARANQAFLRARELDSTIAVGARMHLADLAFMARAALAHARFSTATTGPRGPAYLDYHAAILRGDAARIRAARTRYSHAWARGDEDGIDWAFRGLTLPQTELDSLIRQLESDAVTVDQRHLVGGWIVDAAVMGGRPAAASVAMQRYFGDDSTSAFAAMIDYAVNDSVAAERMAPVVSASGVKQKHPDSCNVALSRLRRGDTSGVATILATEPPLDDQRPAADVVLTVRRGVVAQAAICGQVLRGVLAVQLAHGSSSGDRLLLRADSIMRFTPLNYADFWNYDLALALAQRGMYAAAVSAVQRHFVDLLALPRLVIGLRHEGRWAALAGDTAAAIAAYRHYLLWRQDPEPVLRPQRDSVLAELAALEKRSRSVAR